MILRKNVGRTDRIIRSFVALVLLLAAFFWVGGLCQALLLTIGFVVMATAMTGTCVLYRLFGVDSSLVEKKEMALWSKVLFGVLFLVGIVAGSYYSVFFTKKMFLEDFNAMNNYYKQTLYLTGQGNRDGAIRNYDLLVGQYDSFYDKYTTYHPYSISSDLQLNTDLANVKQTIAALREGVYTGDLAETHTRFEAVRPIFQDILKRNNFSLLSVALVDFHDAMEEVLDGANANDIEQVLAAYPAADVKLKEVELNADDEEVRLIRTKLEELRSLAENGQVDMMPSKAAELKSSFVKVYLKRG